jgi:hypothetical protein
MGGMQVDCRAVRSYLTFTRITVGVLQSLFAGLLLHDRPDDRNHHRYDDDGKAKHAQ